MAKGLGRNYLLWLETATAGTYALIAGQGDLSVSRSRDKIDMSDKTSAGYKLNAYGLADLTIKLDIEPVLPDANGYTRLETLSNAVPALPFNIQVRKGGTAGSTGDVVFQASAYGQVTDQTYGTGDAVKVSAEFSLAAPPTVDTLTI